MKKYLVILALCLPALLAAQDDIGKWEIVDTFEQYWKYPIKGFNCIDSLNCMFLVNGGDVRGYLIRRTTDAGVSWKSVYVDSSVWVYRPKIWDFQYVSKKLALAIGDSGLIIRSTDNGDTWETYRIDTLMAYGKLGMYNEDEGYMLGGRMDSIGKGLKIRFWKTYDGGISWQEEYRSFFEFDNSVLHSFDFLQNVNRNLVIFGCNFTNDDTVRHYLIVKMYNDWTSWDTVSRPVNAYYQCFIDENNGWIAGNNRYKDTNANNAVKQLIYHTSDGGKTWKKQRDKQYRNYNITGIKFYDKNFGIVGSELRLVLFTFDGGKTWHEIEPFEYEAGFNSMSQISIPTPNVAYIFSGWPEEILKWTRTPTSVVEDYNDFDFIISPNPAKDYIEISDVVGEVKLYDVLGAATSPPAPLHSGEGRKVRIDVSSLSPGVYFVSVGGKMYKFVKL